MLQTDVLTAITTGPMAPHFCPTRNRTRIRGIKIRRPTVRRPGKGTRGIEPLPQGPHPRVPPLHHVPNIGAKGIEPSLADRKSVVLAVTPHSHFI